MSGIGFFAVGSGAAFGAWLRWWLGIWLNPLFPTVPMGTLAANLIGGYLMGVVMALFGSVQTLTPELRLLLATGFLGGLTTFSTFSAETTTLLLRQQFGWALTTIGLHVGGSLLMTALGILSFNSLRSL